MPSPTDIIEIDVEKLVRISTLHVAFALFDLRAKEEYQAGHIPGALNMPAPEFLQKIEKLVPKRDTPVVIYDTDGVRSKGLAAQAGDLGYLNIVSLQGGYKEFAKKHPSGTPLATKTLE